MVDKRKKKHNKDNDRVDYLSEPTEAPLKSKRRHALNLRGVNAMSRYTGMSIGTLMNWRRDFNFPMLRFGHEYYSSNKLIDEWEKVRVKNAQIEAAGGRDFEPWPEWDFSDYES